MSTLTLIQAEWNHYNGLVFQLFYIETGKFEGSLFGINLSRNFFYIDIFFKSIKVFDKTD